MGEEAQPTSPAARAGASAVDFTAAIDRIRKRADATAKGIAGIGTAAITAIGYAKLADVFPFGGPAWALFALGLGVLAMITGVLVLAKRFNRVAESVVTKTDIEKTVNFNKLKGREIELLTEAYKETARLNDVSSLRALEARGHRYARLADFASPAKAKDLEARVADISSAIGFAEARAATFILRHRARRALISAPSILAVAAFVIGWYATALGSDDLQSQRTEAISLVKECAEARSAKEANPKKLPVKICGAPPAKGKRDQAEEPSSLEVRDAGITALATALQKCHKASAKTSVPPNACLPLARALSAGTPGSRQGQRRP